MGNNLYAAEIGNPKGFFEDAEVNGINEDILAEVVPKRPPFIGKFFYKDRPEKWQRWLARVSLETKMHSSDSINKRIEELVKKEPFCFKDPRFSYTLPIWRPFLKNTAFICVFRHPASTAVSILKECENARYLHSLSINFEKALEVWTLIYRHILDIHRFQGRWLFLHYNQALSEEGLNKISGFLDCNVDYSFPDPSLRRSISNRPIPQITSQIYKKLCELADYRDF